MFRGVEGFEVSFTASCSGCMDFGEAGENLHNYPIDPKSGVHLGGGCDECGYTGKRRRREWVPFDPDEALRSIERRAQVESEVSP